MVALPVSAQNVEPVPAEFINFQIPVPPSWSLLEDADQDGMMDIDEILWGMDPLNPEDGLSDLDGDEIFLAWEFAIGTNPTMADTDTDDWSDSEEYLLYGTDPLNSLSFPQGGAPDRGGDTAPTSPSSVIPEPEAVLPPPPPPPSLSNGDFSDVSITVWKSALSSKAYQGRGFRWGAGAVTSWTAYVGTTVEVWDAGGEKFIELDGSRGNYGIKQGIANAKAGGYILTWRQSGRNSSRAGTDPYRVRIYYMNGTTEVPIGQSPEFAGFSKMQWTDNAFGFQITPEQLASAGANPIYVAFIPTGASLNTYGTLIDKVCLMPVEIDMAIASYGDLADLPDYDELTKSPVSPPHEMDPGSLVITPTKNELHPRKRSRLTLSMISNPVYYGNFSLTMQGLDPEKVGIYETPDGGKPITLPKIWQASDFPASVTYYVGALPFEEEAELQDGTLELGYTPTSNTKLIQPIEKDTVRVKVIPTSANLMISSIKDVDALPEDRGADGQGLMPPHEMEPGSLVVAPVDWRVTPATRSKLVLKAKGAFSADAQFTLTPNNLSKVAIYNEQTGGTPLMDQELTWSASQLNAGVTVHVGALSFAAGDAAQDGTLTLTGKIIPPGASESEAVEVKDTVRVRLEPLAVDLKIVRFNNDPEDLAENDLAETSPVSTAHEMDPGSLVLAPVDGYPHPPGYRSRLTLTRSENTSAIGTITLTNEELNNVVIYDDEQRFEDFRKVNLPKQWEAHDFVNGLVLHVGSNPFAIDAAAQDGTLTLTHRVSAAEGLPYVEIKDAVRVTLNPLTVDLAIASIGNENYLAEDRQLNGLTAPTPHEMNPGSMVIAPVQGNASPGTRSQLKLSAKGQGSTSGTYTLTSQNLSKVEIYSSPTGGSPLLPADLQWAAEDLVDDKLLYVGSQAFGPTEQAQEGTLTFTFTPTLTEGSQSTAAIGDKVRVRLMPVAVDLAIASIGNEAYLANDRQPGGDAQPPPNELDPGSIVVAPIQGNSSPGTRSRLKLSAMGQGSTSGVYTLTTKNLSKVAIYSSPTGGTPLLPADLQWAAEDLVDDKLLYVGSQPFAPTDLAQDGILSFTFTPNFTTGLQSSVSFEDHVRVQLVPVEIVFSKPDDWADLPEEQVILFDEETRIQIKIGKSFESLEQAIQMCGLNPLQLSTNGTCPAGVDIILNSTNSTYVSNKVSSEVRVTFTRQQLKDKGLLQPKEVDGVNEIAWYDFVKNEKSNLNDSLAFDNAHYSGVGWTGMRGRGYDGGNIEENHGRPLDKTLWQAGGAQVIVAQSGGAVSKHRQLSDQADVFFFSGHGAYASGNLEINHVGSPQEEEWMTPGETKWDKDMDLVIVNACAVFGIKSGKFRYKNFSERHKIAYNKSYKYLDPSPGEKWESLSPPIKLGYCFTSPLDSTGISEATVKKYGELVNSGKDPIAAWGEANIKYDGRYSNACAIDTSKTPHEYWYVDSEQFWMNIGEPEKPVMFLVKTPLWKKVVRGPSGW